jgi:ribosomal protein L22
MKFKTKIRKVENRIIHERSKSERVGALMLAAATIFGMAYADKQAAERAVVALPQNVIFKPAAEPIDSGSHQNEIEQSEVSRMPVKFDDAITKTAPISGK